jgi:hypothetical protein
MVMYLMYRLVDFVHHHLQMLCEYLRGDTHVNEPMNEFPFPFPLLVHNLNLGVEIMQGLPMLGGKSILGNNSTCSITITCYILQ